MSPNTTTTTTTTTNNTEPRRRVSSSGSTGTGCPFSLSTQDISTLERRSQHHQQPIHSNSPAESSSVPNTNTNINTNTNTNLTPLQALQLAKQACPAFKSSCPFRDVQDAESMKQALQSLPRSHLDSVNGNGNASSVSDHTSITDGSDQDYRDAVHLEGDIDTDIDNDTDTDTDGNNRNHDHLRRERGNSIHSDISESLRVALTHVHTISQSLTSGGNGNGGTGTANSSIADEGEVHGPNHSAFEIVNAMEELSLFSLMGKIIERKGSTSLHSNPGSPRSSPKRSLSLHIPNVASLSRTDTDIGTDTDTDADNHHPNDGNTTNSQNSSAPSAALKETGTGMGMGMRRVKSTTSLSNALKHGTQESHTAAESVHFVKEFIKGNIDRTLYSILMLNLLHLYKNLEGLLDEHAPNCFPTLYFPKELSRTEALMDDVDFYHGEGVCAVNMKENCAVSSKATRDYIQRIQFVAEREPLLLLSHAYTRYLGDLSGGKVLARVAKRALNLQGDDEGLAFYQFDEIPSAKLFKDGYRKALDELSLEDDEIERLVAEANVAFVLNMRIFEELDVQCGIEGAEVRDYEKATVYYEDCIKKQNERRKFGSIGVADGDAVGAGLDVNAMEDEHHGKGGDIKKCPFAALGGPNPHKSFTTISTDANKTINTLPLAKEDSGIVAEVKDLKSVQQDLHNTNVISTGTSDPVARCPWPFIFFHEPAQGMKDWQTWIVIGLLLCYFWSLVESFVL